MKGLFYEAVTSNPYENLAIEEYLLHQAEERGIPILYLWQNENTIVIGRNQNVYTECNMEFVEKNHIKIARRLTGGGAVYHDMGNLNFSIILPRCWHNIERSTDMVVSALNQIGISAAANGRNDICLGDKKISGNAYYSNDMVGLHHGTILFQVNMDKVARALSVPKYKLSKRGIPSIKSRIGDVVSQYPNIHLDEIKQQLKNTFLQEYEMERLVAFYLKDDIQDLLRKYSSKEWVFNQIKEYEESLTQDFPKGTVTISIQYIERDAVNIDIATDMLEVDWIEQIKCSMRQKIEKHELFDIQQAMQDFTKEYEQLFAKL